MDWLRFIDIMGLVLGLLYLWLEYRASIWLWAVSVIMPIVHGYLYFAKGLYADFGMEFYYVAIAIYGYWCWRRGSKKSESKELPITTYKKSHAVASLATGVVLWGLIYWILIAFTDSKIPVVDSFTTSLSAVAMWALAKKYVEQWILWFMPLWFLHSDGCSWTSQMAQTNARCQIKHNAKSSSLFLIVYLIHN